MYINKLKFNKVTYTSPYRWHRYNIYMSESIKVECYYCGNSFDEDDAVRNDDGDQFCSEDCRREWEQDKAVARAESWGDLD